MVAPRCGVLGRGLSAAAYVASATYVLIDMGVVHIVAYRACLRLSSMLFLHLRVAGQPQPHESKAATYSYAA